ncbi:S-adenosyl methyltransferase [Lentzea atacamensis]|uniref:S-adenosyl methyltransferase n=1 Tax=Lentzea atacamensis TaxID=531938 RepID=A0A316HUH3_9PSEU|nr:SAM-dependent methyltransferase [Lentzea atacamensis]PWK84238.1 S-adenosyl methyltransferase [Lentzea atacamensis]RAS69106.1 S-adenosyl methyltransferase [Lentzea atacamensis]
MQDGPKRVTTNGDSERPNVARLFDYYLGGAHNFAVDRALAEESIKRFPVAEMARTIRSFSRRVIRLCVEEMGIRQFLDLGSGIPTAGNVHEVAQSIDPSCSVVYVDHDPVTVAHARTMLRDNLSAAIVQADVRDVGAVLRHPETRRLIDFTKPTAVLMVGILPYITDEPAGMVARYRAALCEGSVLALTHLTKDVEPGLVDQLVDLSDGMGSEIVPRTKQDVADFVCGLKLLEPGLVLAAHWRADGELPGTSAAADASTYGAVGVII